MLIFNYDADPAALPQSWNRYAYVNGSPLNATDPLGLICVDTDGHAVTDMDGATSKDNCGGEGGTWIEQQQTVTVTATPDGATLASIGPVTLVAIDGGVAAAVSTTVPNVANSTIGPYKPPVLDCLGQAALQVGLDATSLSVIANQDDWRWNSGTMGFDYVGGSALISVGGSDAVGAAGSAANHIAGSKPAQRTIKGLFRDVGAGTTMKEVSRVAGWAGAIAVELNKAEAISDALNRFESCRN